MRKPVHFYQAWNVRLSFRSICAVSLPQAAKGCLAAITSVSSLTGSGRSEPFADGTVGHRRVTVESRCGAVIVGEGCLLPPLSSGGAQVPLP
jgi:hypothetical protein